mmetsp:Transcript_1206/g.1358  ORF Transcript_1206/g.1358 Transcript_1206/m.1358 type:complete len:409 (-) Transcript_1206:9-1235(-)
MEGLGGEVSLDHYNLDGIDPALEDCCRREVEGNRKYNALASTLRRHDIAALAERRRLHLVKIPYDACRCSCDPKSDGGEYQALIEFKEQKQREQEKEAERFREREEEQTSEKEELDVPSNNNYRSKNKGSLDDDEENNSVDSDDEFDYLLDEDFGMEGQMVRELEEKRRAELEYLVLMRQIAGYHGYGVHRQIHPSRVLRVAGLGRESTSINASSSLPPPPAVVLHLVDPDSIASASLDYYLETDLAKECAGTIFLRSSGRSVLEMDLALAQKSFPSNVLSPDRAIPALIAIRDGVVVNTCPRLLGLASSSDGIVEPHAVRHWLDRSGVLLPNPPTEDICMIRPEQEVHMDFMVSQQQQKQAPPPEEIRYNCGIKGCHKSFKHEHVGVKTETSDGLVVKEETVLGNDS